MTLALVAMSHSPLLEHADLEPAVRAELEEAFGHARAFVQDFDPDVVVNFAPDHYNGFFYDLMPPYCVGYAARSVGDYGTQAARLDVPAPFVRDLAESVLADDVDVAVSLDMEVDHGAVQPMEILFGDVTARPLVPVFINSVAPPFTPVRRIRLLGEAIGRHLRTVDRKVLLIASGGLSHDPPVPRLATATPEQHRALLGGRRSGTNAMREERQGRVIAAARAFAAGEGNIQDLAPEWDRQVMDLLASGDLTAMDDWSPDEMTRAAGNSSHEVRTWIAAYAALGTVGPYRVRYRYYRPIRELIAGFGLTTASLD